MSIRAELRSHAAVTGLCVLAAAAYLTIGLVRHNTWLTISGPLIMLGYAAVLVRLSSRSEPAAMLAGTRGDERQQQVQLRAAAWTTQVLVIAIIAGVLWSLAIGAETAAGIFCGLAAVGGLSFGASMFWLARHS